MEYREAMPRKLASSLFPSGATHVGWWGPNIKEPAQLIANNLCITLREAEAIVAAHPPGEKLTSYVRNSVGSRRQKFVEKLAEFGEYDTWMTDGFGVQITPDSGPGNRHGTGYGWTYSGGYKQNERHGLGEIAFHKDQDRRGKEQEKGGRVIGCWNEDHLHGPAFQYYPPGSWHYRGDKNTDKAHVTVVWFEKNKLLRSSEIWVADDHPALHARVLAAVTTLRSHSDNFLALEAVKATTPKTPSFDLEFVQASEDALLPSFGHFEAQWQSQLVVLCRHLLAICKLYPSMRDKTPLLKALLASAQSQANNCKAKPHKRKADVTVTTTNTRPRLDKSETVDTSAMTMVNLQSQTSDSSN